MNFYDYNKIYDSLRNVGGSTPIDAVYPVTNDLIVHVESYYRGYPVNQLMDLTASNEIGRMIGQSGTTINPDSTAPNRMTYVSTPSADFNNLPHIQGKTTDGGSVLRMTAPCLNGFTQFMATTRPLTSDRYLNSTTKPASSPAIIANYNDGIAVRDFEFWISLTTAQRHVIRNASTSTEVFIICIQAGFNNGDPVKAWIDGAKVVDTTLTYSNPANNYIGMVFNGIGAASQAGLNAANNRWGCYSLHSHNSSILTESQVDEVNNYLIKKWKPSIILTG